MYLLDFTVRSSCGLSAVATRTDASLFILDVFRMEPSVNSVAALTLSRDLGGEIRKALSSDFTKFRIEADRKATLITGRKKGHGVMDAIILGGGGTLVFPVIATGGTERFRVIVSSRGGTQKA
ncbi:hypothetical protein [Thermogymnomonas acidicola]|uniref:hypothetical protein n=1 Tax=Thermogymnomonas acidicola TaxID=399579 RepID=UPI00094627EE|nr:hypothetical protein [Thermogymnomonas acidicola]